MHDDLLRRHVRQQLPERLALRLRVQIPHRVDDRCEREVDHALLRAEPSQLRVGGEPPPETGEVGGDPGQRLPDDEVTERLDRRDAHLVAAPDRECQSMPLEPWSVRRMTYRG